MARLARRGLGQADMGQFGIGIGYPGQRRVIHLRGQAEQRVADDDSRMVAGDVGEFRPAADIADREDAPVGAAQPRIDRDATRRGFDTGHLQAEARGVRSAPGGDQQMCPGQHNRAGRAAQFEFHAIGGAACGEHLCAFMQRDALMQQPGAQDSHGLRLILGQVGGALDERHHGTEAAEGLRHFHPDRPAAEHEQVVRPVGQSEYGLVGEVGRLAQARHGRHGGGRAGGDDNAPRADPLACGLDFMRPGETGGGLDDGDAQRLEALDAVMRGGDGDDAVHMRTHLGKVHGGFAPVHAEAAASTHRLRRIRSGEQRLRRHAARVEAIPTHQVLLDQDNGRPHLRGTGRDRKAAGASADDAEVGVQGPIAQRGAARRNVGGGQHCIHRS